MALLAITGPAVEIYLLFLEESKVHSSPPRAAQRRARTADLIRVMALPYVTEQFTAPLVVGVVFSKALQSFSFGANERKKELRRTNAQQ